MRECDGFIGIGISLSLVRNYQSGFGIEWRSYKILGLFCRALRFFSNEISRENANELHSRVLAWGRCLVDTLGLLYRPAEPSRAVVLCLSGRVCVGAVLPCRPGGGFCSVLFF